MRFHVYVLVVCCGFLLCIYMLLSKKKLKFFRLLVMASTLFLDQKGAAENDFYGYELLKLQLFPIFKN